MIGNFPPEGDIQGDQYRKWLSDKIQCDIQQIILQDDMKKAGGLACEIVKMKILLSSDHQQQPRSINIIAKSIINDRLEKSVRLGQAREGIFYQKFASEFEQSFDSTVPILAKVYYSYGDMENGQKIIIMEDLSGDNYLQSGYYFGPYSPHNWGKDLPHLLNTIGLQIDEVDVTRKAFRCAAQIHAYFWMRKDIREYFWIRNSDVNIQSNWNEAEKLAKNMWNQRKQKIIDGQCSIKWNSNLIQCIDACLKKSSYLDYINQQSKSQWTLIHGDFHPANMLIEKTDSQNWGIRILDFEMVAVGSGPQDLSQYVISHMEPALRKSSEKHLVQDYYNLLIQCITNRNDLVGIQQNYTFQQCWNDYIEGGVGRWIWLLIFLSHLCPDNMVQYFQDQLSVFMQDHGINEENVPMPRF